MSKGIEDHPLVQRYLNKVRAQVKAKEMHEDIKLEIISHLEESVMEKVERDCNSKEEAIEEALMHMGDPEQVGKQLHAAHKPKPEWGLIVLVGAMMIIGIVTFYSLLLSQEGNLLVGRKLVYGIIGISALFGFYFIDYRRMLRYSELLYGGTIILMAAPLLQGNRMQGTLQWFKVGLFNRYEYINVYAAAPYLLIISIAGMLQKEVRVEERNLHRTITKLGKEIAVYMLIPAFFYVSAPALTYFIIYILSLTVLLIISKKKLLLFSGLALLAFSICPILLSSSFRFAWQRFFVFLHPQTDSQGIGYLTLRSLEAVHSGGMWGQGLGVVNRQLPYVSSELLYSYLIYSLGWIFGIAIAVIVLMFIARVTFIGSKLQDHYAKRLVIGLTAVMGIQLLWNLLMCIGFLPILGVQLPIMNWSSGTMIELGAIGLMLSAYRRKDMRGSSLPPQMTTF